MPPPPTSLLRESALSAGIDCAAHLHSSLTALTVTMCVVTTDTLAYRWRLSHDNGCIISCVIFGGRQGGQHQHSRGRTGDHGRTPSVLSSLVCASHAILEAICRTRSNTKSMLAVEHVRFRCMQYCVEKSCCITPLNPSTAQPRPVPRGL